MKFWSEFKEFAVKGNVADLAIAVVIGGAFGKITNSLVQDIIMPPLAFLLGKVEYKNLKWVIQKGQTDASGTVTAPELSMNIGSFIEVTLNFFIIALCLFMVIKFINSLKRKAEDVLDESVPTPKEITLLNDIKTKLDKKT